MKKLGIRLPALLLVLILTSSLFSVRDHSMTSPVSGA